MLAMTFCTAAMGLWAYHESLEAEEPLVYNECLALARWWQTNNMFRGVPLVDLGKLSDYEAWCTSLELWLSLCDTPIMTGRDICEQQKQKR